MSQRSLRDATTEERATWLAAGARELLAKARDAPEELAESTGLSAEMVEWGARTTLETIRAEALTALAAEAYDARGEPIPVLSVVLAGNLFTAAARAIMVPLLLGVPVVAKASSREKLFPEMIRDALRTADAALGDALDVVVFSGGDLEPEAALIESSAATAVYGTDETIEAIRRRHPGAHLIPHGHGVSVGYCGAEALEDDRIDDTIAGLALDICAYDQRGCLSPQVIYVAKSGICPASKLAQRLAEEGLRPLEKALPRGPLPLEAGAAQAQWRGIAEVEGSLVTGDSYAIAVRPPRPIRWSPAYRNVTLAPVEGVTDAVEAMSELGASLKCVGVDAVSFSEVQCALEAAPNLSAYACRTGTMQTPPLDAPADGKPIWHGLLR